MQLSIKIALVAFALLVDPATSLAQDHSFFTLKNANANRCLNVHAGRDNRDGAPSTIYSCADTLDQEWEIKPAGGGYSQLQNRSTGRCLAIDRATQNREGGAVTVGDCAATSEQHWKILPRGDGKSQVRNRATNRCLNVHGGRDNRDGGRVTSYTCAASSDQKWSVKKLTRLTASCGAPERFAGGRLWLPHCVSHSFTHRGSRKQLTVYYTEASNNRLDILFGADTNGDGTKDLKPSAIATRIAGIYEDAWTKYLDYGFPNPVGSDVLDVHIFEMGKGGWCCHQPSGLPPDTELSANTSWTSFEDDNDARSDVRVLKGAIYHEMWHAAELAIAGPASSEGLAVLMSDQVSLDVDNHSGSDFMSRTSEYLGGGYKRQLDIHDYDGALWWKYFSEQMGAPQAEPRAGTDAISRAANHPQPLSIAAINTAIGRFVPDTDLEDVWVNFTVANIAKDYQSTASLPSKYRYRDAVQPGAPPYRRLASLELDTALSANQSRSDRRGMTIKPWSARYFVIRPSARASKLTVDFAQSSSGRLSYSTLVLARGNMVEVRRSGRNFRHTLNDVAGATVIVVVTGLPGESDATLRYSFSSAN